MEADDGAPRAPRVERGQQRPHDVAVGAPRRRGEAVERAARRGDGRRRVDARGRERGARRYLTGLLPPNRTRLSDDKCNAIFEAACADYWKEAKCPWPTFLFLLNFLKCSAMYMPDEAEGDEELSDEDESDRGAPKKRMSQRLSALGSAIWGSQKTEPRSKKKKKKRKKKKEKTTPEPLAEETKIPDPFGDVAGAGLAEAQHLNELAHKAPVLGETMEFLEETEKGLETELVGVGTPSKAAQHQSLVAQFFCGETDPEGRANAPGDFPASPFCSGGRGGAGDAPAEDPPAPPKQ